ncbi:MAG: acyl-[acyl-carrier-protein]-phospholipid O-acyltransferase [Candidatus Omnitrophota bacterium]|jgi:acyl-[acyl-carrier-protein]-phospholipid O-acyltransferase/long-chain-fatty-acid--[acyl-carrier-protein] ligase
MEVSNPASTFKWHNLAQFFGALNDNLFRYYIIFFLVGMHGKLAAERISADIGVLFAIPFLLFISFAGVMADRYSKSRVVFLIKGVECVIMLFGVLAFYLKSEILLYVLMFFMATQSAFFSPTKFGIVPELVPSDKISRANSYLQALTYLAIIIGTAMAPLAIRLCGGHYERAAIFCVGLAGLGLLCSRWITPTPIANPSAKFSPLFLLDIWKSISLVRKDPFLFLAVISAAYFLFIGSYVQLNVIPYGLKELGIPMEQRETTAYLFLFAAVGIGIGSLLAGRLSGRSVEFGIVPIGALLMTVGAVGLNFCPRTYLGAGTFFVIFGLGGGFFIVPVQAFIQLRSPREKLGEILAATSFLSWIGVIIASQLLKFLDQVAHFTPGQGFVVLGVATFLLMIAAFFILPDFFFRFVGTIITRLGYRIRVVGEQNLPIDGPALLVCNHAALLDAAVLQATTQRRMRFLMSRAYFEASGWMKPLLRLMRVILVHEDDTPKNILRSLKSARQSLDEGYLVVIFAEGHITRNGMMREFKPGLEHIVRKSNHPIIPTFIGGAWGSIFSYYHRTSGRKLPAKFPYPVSVVYGEAMAGDATSFDVQQAVRELSCRYFEDRKSLRTSLATEWVRSARRNWRRRALKDTLGKDLTHGETLTAVVALSKIIGSRIGDHDKVGVLMPTTAAGALVNLSLAMLDRIAVNLNYTASASAFGSAVSQCELTVMITTRPFLEKLPDLPLTEQVLYLEDLSAELQKMDKLRALLQARWLPVRWLTTRREPFHPDQLATIIFSSGSTSDPKGVMLSHHNILSNVESLRAIMLPTRTDNVCSALPFFHSFGYTCTLWFPLLSGFSASYHTKPLEGAKIAELARESHSTILVSTPTFLLSCIRRAKPEDFKFLRMVFVGAEKLKPRIAEAFEQKFGLRPLEGYGATELSPVAAGSVHDVAYDGYHQQGWQEGSVGQPVLGMAFKVVDPDTHAPLAPDQSGLLMVKGPNVMQGYLNQPEKTREVLNEGWYNTGDIAVLQKDGFVRITDRLARFSKIAGEMVPHTAIEETVQQALGKVEPVVAVASLPDEKKGEKLILFYVETVSNEAQLAQIIKDSSLPNLWKPSCYVCVGELPLLGSGKLDLKGLKDLALKQS